MRSTLAALSLTLLASACSSTPAPATNTAANAATSAARHAARLHRYTSPADGFETNSWWLSTGHGVIVFDAQFLPEYAEALVTAIGREAPGEAITDVVVLHGNPDKYNGLGVIRSHFASVRIHTSAGVVARMREVDAGKRGFFGPLYGARYPRETVFPDNAFTGTRDLQVGDVTVHLRTLSGPGVSTEHVVAMVEDSGELVTGDLVQNQAHGWLAEGFSDRWLQRLDELDAMHATTIAPGRGAAGEASALITAWRGYLTTFQRAVAPFARAALTDAQKTEIRGQLTRAFSGWAMEGMLDFSIPGEHTRQHGG